MRSEVKFNKKKKQRERDLEMTKKDALRVTVTSFSSFSSSSSSLSSSIFFCERTIHLSQMNTNAMPDYRRKRRRIEEHEKRLNKSISVSWYRVTLALAKYYVKSRYDLPSPLSKRKRIFKNTCRDSRDKNEKNHCGFLRLLQIMQNFEKW